MISCRFQLLLKTLREIIPISDPSVICIKSQLQVWHEKAWKCLLGSTSRSTTKGWHFASWNKSQIKALLWLRRSKLVRDNFKVTKIDYFQFESRYFINSLSILFWIPSVGSPDFFFILNFNASFSKVEKKITQLFEFLPLLFLDILR